VVGASNLRLESISAQRRRYSLNLPFSIPPSFNPQFSTVLICPGSSGQTGGRQLSGLFVAVRPHWFLDFNVFQIQELPADGDRHGKKSDRIYFACVRRNLQLQAFP